LLLRDAVCLYRAGSYASATVLAAFAREELGKSILLRKLRDDVLTDETIAVDDIAKKMKDHIEKQGLSALHVMLRYDNKSDFGKLTEIMKTHAPGSTEYRAAELKFRKLTVERAKAAPRERHADRMDCLYVDQRGDGKGWKRPADQSKQDANDFLCEAANDYSSEYQSMQTEFRPYEMAEFVQALNAWADRPAFPAPEWPHG
jgi:AbiV family abortive infection protein